MQIVPQPRSMGVGFGSAFVPTLAYQSQTTVTAGAVNVKGAWVTLEASTKYEVYGFWVALCNTNTSAASVRNFYDIGIGAAGVEQVIVPNFINTTASTASYHLGGYTYFPLFIPAGTRVAIRLQSSIASNPGNASIMFNYGGAPLTPIFQKCDALGITIASSNGVPMNSAVGSFGTLTTVATATKDYRALIVSATTQATTGTTQFVSVGVRFGGGDFNGNDQFRRPFISTADEGTASCNFMPYWGYIASGTVLQAHVWGTSIAHTYHVGLYAFY